MRPKILLTNDDGVNSGGLWAAYEALSAFADVTVVAPAVQQSAVGRSISIFEPLRMNEVWIGDRSAYSVEGRPTDALLLGLYGLNLKPDLVVSGINLGENISYESITTSGTVGAAMEAANQGVPALASGKQVYRSALPHAGLFPGQRGCSKADADLSFIRSSEKLPSGKYQYPCLPYGGL